MSIVLICAVILAAVLVLLARGAGLLSFRTTRKLLGLVACIGYFLISMMCGGCSTHHCVVPGCNKLHTEFYITEVESVGRKIGTGQVPKEMTPKRWLALRAEGCPWESVENWMEDDLHYQFYAGVYQKSHGGRLAGWEDNKIFLHREEVDKLLFLHRK